MTNYTLKFWGASNGMSRIYVTNADGASVGHAQRVIKTAARGTQTAYDRHRHAKGDSVDVVADLVTFDMSAEILADLVTLGAAEFGPLKADHDDLSVWFLLQEMTEQTRAARKTNAAKAKKNAAKYAPKTPAACAFTVGQTVKTRVGQLLVVEAIEGSIIVSGGRKFAASGMVAA